MIRSLPIRTSANRKDEKAKLDYRHRRSDRVPSHRAVPAFQLSNGRDRPGASATAAVKAYLHPAGSAGEYRGWALYEICSYAVATRDADCGILVDRGRSTPVDNRVLLRVEDKQHRHAVQQIWTLHGLRRRDVTFDWRVARQARRSTGRASLNFGGRRPGSRRPAVLSHLTHWLIAASTVSTAQSTCSRSIIKGGENRIADSPAP